MFPTLPLTLLAMLNGLLVGFLVRAAIRLRRFRVNLEDLLKLNGRLHAENQALREILFRCGIEFTLDVRDNAVISEVTMPMTPRFGPLH